MEEDSTEKPVAKSAVMLPPSQSLTSTVLNGMGNGMTVGGIPLIVAETSAFFTKRNLKPREMMIYSSLLAAGAVIGAVFGVAEAKQITNYRNSLNDEINRLHDKEATNDQKIDALMKAVGAKTTPEPTR